MKKLLTPAFIITATLVIFAFRSELISSNQFHKSPLNSGGSQAAKTGAPGEQNCTSCHGGSTLAGANENLVVLTDASNNVVSSYQVGQTYTVSLNMASNPSKKGFQATALTNTDVMAGDFTTGVTTQISSSQIAGGTRKYANHKSNSNTSATALWSWNWTAPATNVGNVTFYVASNKANNNGAPSGDQIYLSQHVIIAPSTVGVEESEFQSFFKASFNVEKNGVDLQFSSLKVDKMHINIVDLTGKSVLSKNLGMSKIGVNSEFVSFPTQLPKGYYVVNMFLNNKATSNKIVVQ